MLLKFSLEAALKFSLKFYLSSPAQRVNLNRARAERLPHFGIMAQILSKGCNMKKFMILLAAAALSLAHADVTDILKQGADVKNVDTSLCH